MGKTQRNIYREPQKQNEAIGEGSNRRRYAEGAGGRRVTGVEKITFLDY